MKATIYIKKEDEELWRNVKDKSAFVSDALNGEDTNPDFRREKLKQFIVNTVDIRVREIMGGY